MLLRRASEGQLMNGDTRNTKVVVCLILAMTAGALLLLLLEPRPAPADVSATVPLTARAGTPVEDVLIEFAAPDAGAARNADCLILPDGTCDWRADGLSGPRVRLAVVGSNANGLPDEQKRSLLAVLDNLRQGRAGRMLRVRLHPGFDARLRPVLPPEVRDLCDLLVRKGMIE